jgi:O-acetyl-ADP-ribose deacetylase (regulator of RNase III)
MKIVHGDLLEANEPIVHCISSDCALGAGIAKAITQKYGTKAKLYPYRVQIMSKFKNEGGFAVRTGNVINLVTKERYSDKPTYKTLTQALKGLKNLLIQYKIKNISMPAIGCGLDKLNLNEVKKIIYDVFSDSDINITMYLK